MSPARDTIELRHLPAQNLLLSPLSQTNEHDDSPRDDGRFDAHHGVIIDSQVSEQQLCPADGGAAAWRFLFGAFMVEALQWG